VAICRWLPGQGALHRKKGDEQASKSTCQERGVGPNPTDRGKLGVKTSLLVEAEGGPLALCVAGANVNDHLLLEATLAAVVVERPFPTEANPQHLCLDKGYENALSRQVAQGHGYTLHIRSIREEGLAAASQDAGIAGIADHADKKPRRWVVERTLSWLQRWRGILIRWEKKPQNYLASLKLASALLWFRRAWKLGSPLLR